MMGINSFSLLRFLLTFALAVTLTACGGSSEGGSSNDARLVVSESRIEFTAEEDGARPSSKSFTATITNLESAQASGTFIYVFPNYSGNHFSSIDYDLNLNPVPIVIYPNFPSLSPGRYTGELRIEACTDFDCTNHIAGSPFTLEVVYTITAGNNSSDSGSSNNDSSDSGSSNNDSSDSTNPQDADGDGVRDAEDTFPNNPNETTDTDNDGIGDNADTDADNDGIENGLDACPLVPKPSDFDDDCIPNDRDTDDDNDSYRDSIDDFPLDPNEWLDTDSDGVGNNADEDDDNDSYPDNDDAFPLDSTEWVDTDSDAIGNNTDPDDDNDSYRDSIDDFPLDPNEWLDTDSDGVGNNADEDDDNDSYLDNDDAFPLDSTEWVDTDSDGIGNNADPDDDNDTYRDEEDSFPLDASEWLDTDADGIGNNADEDDDNDSYIDTEDAFPLDSTEWVDTDSDGIGNNADTNDDNDRLLDVDDPRPLDAKAPGELYTVSPGTIVKDRRTSIVLAGAYLSADDTFYVDNERVDVTLLNDQAVALDILPDSDGELSVSIQYEDHTYTSIATVEVVEPVYYPYSVASVGGSKNKAYFEPITQSLYVHNSSISEVTRFQYQSGGLWEDTSLSLANLRSIGLSPDLKHLYALREKSLLRIDQEGFFVDIDNPIDIDTGRFGSRTILSDLEFDYANKAVIVTDYRGSGSTLIYSYDFEPQSETFEMQSSLLRLYNSAIGRSVDGTSFMLGESGLSPVQNLVQYRPIEKILGEVSPTAQFRRAAMDLTGSKIIINNTNIYNKSFSLIGQLDGLSNSVIDQTGNFIIGSDSSGTLHWYDSSNLEGQILTSKASASISEDVGTINSLVLSQDGLTLFVLGSNKMIVVPVWQIIEDAIGNANTCPTAGCGDINVAQGIVVGGGTPVAPAFDDEASPLKNISPTYTGINHQFEVLLTGSGFAPASVVQFGDTLATNVRYVNDTEMRATIPTLTAGSYQVTVDGHRLDAPTFRVIDQASITVDSWAIGGDSVELLYNPLNHSLYNLDRAGKLLTKIDLSNNSTQDRSIANATDLTWCGKDEYLYVPVDKELRRYNANTLSFVDTLAPDVNASSIDRLECVAEGRLVLSAEDQWEYVHLYDPGQDEIIPLTRNSLYSPTVDGVSAKGDRIYFGESGITSPDRVVLVPHLRILNVTSNVGAFRTSSWSDDGSLGVVNASEVLNDSFSKLGTLDVGTTISAVVVAPDASAIYAISNDAVVHKIPFNPANPSKLEATTTYDLVSSLGTIRRAEISLDGKTVFVSGTNRIEAISVE